MKLTKSIYIVFHVVFKLFKLLLWLSRYENQIVNIYNWFNVRQDHLKTLKDTFLNSIFFPLSLSLFGLAWISSYHQSANAERVGRTESRCHGISLLSRFHRFPWWHQLRRHKNRISQYNFLSRLLICFNGSLAQTLFASSWVCSPLYYFLYYWRMCTFFEIKCNTVD